MNGKKRDRKQNTWKIKEKVKEEIKENEKDEARKEGAKREEGRSIELSKENREKKGGKS